jgi:hypothetical protein
MHPATTGSEQRILKAVSKPGPFHLDSGATTHLLDPSVPVESVANTPTRIAGIGGAVTATMSGKHSVFGSALSPNQSSLIIHPSESQHQSTTRYQYRSASTNQQQLSSIKRIITQHSQPSTNQTSIDTSIVQHSQQPSTNQQ